MLLIGRSRRSVAGAALLAIAFVCSVIVPPLDSARAGSASSAGTFTSLSPARILDTRNNIGLTGVFAPNQIRDLTVIGVGGVPATAVDAVALNVTVTQPSASGFLTLFPTGDALPLASNLNFVANQTVPNLVVVKVGDGGTDEGKVSIANTALPSDPQPGAGTVHVIADVVGWYSDGTTPDAARFTGLAPSRILDTRPSSAFTPNETRNLTVTGVGGVPAGVDSVVLNVTVTQPSAAGFLTLFPAGQALPLASNLNFVAGQTVPNLVIVKVGAGGQVSIANTALPAPPQPPAGTVHVIVDVVGYYAAGATGSSLASVAPQRVLDTRSTPAVPVQPNATILIDPVAGSGLPPAGSYTGVVLNVTVTGPSQAGFLTAYPSDATLPLASNLNFTANQTVPNLVMAKVGADGRIKLANTRLPTNPQPGSGTVHVVVDIVGYYTDGTTTPPVLYASPPQGTWVNAYGSDGYALGAFNEGVGDASFLPKASFTVEQASRFCWACSTPDVRALQSVDTFERNAAVLFDANQVRARLNFTAPYTGILHLYAVDWDTTARRESVTVNDGRGPQTVDITTSFNQGAWMHFPVYVATGGTVTVTVNRNAGLNAVLSGIFLGEPGAPPTPAPPSTSIGQYCHPSTSDPSQYQTAFDNLRKANLGSPGSWATADGSIPVALPDGRTLHLYGDTFVGNVNSSGGFSPSKLVENSAVLQNGTCFNPMLRGSPSSRSAWIPQPQPGHALWPSSAVVDASGNLQVFLMRVRYDPFHVFGFQIATFSLPNLTPGPISGLLPFTGIDRTYGTTALVDNGFAYLYSTNDQNQRLARVPLTSVTTPGAYQFWNGTAWVSDHNQAVALTFSGVPDPPGFPGLEAPISGLWVVRHGNGYLGTAMLVNAFSNHLALFTSTTPQGPWSYAGQAETTPAGRLSYGALTTFRLKGMLPVPAIVYSVNLFQETPDNISEYGPRFVVPDTMPPPLP